MNFTFLSVTHVIEIHSEQIDLCGGEHGVRDLALLESAIATPRATFGGELLHPTVFAAAAAYLFHIVQNHPFIDGNKRAGLATAVIFLRINGITLEMNDELLLDLVLRVATGKALKPEIEAAFREHSLPN